MKTSEATLTLPSGEQVRITNVEGRVKSSTVREKHAAELAAIRSLDQKLEGKDVDIFLTTRGGVNCLEARVGDKAFRHRGSLVLGIAKLLNLLDGEAS